MELTKDDILHEIEKTKQEKTLFKKLFPKVMKLNNIKIVWHSHQIIPSKKMENQIKRYFLLIRFHKLLNVLKILRVMK